MRGLRTVRLKNQQNFYLWCFLLEGKKKADEAEWDKQGFKSWGLNKALKALEKCEFEVINETQAKQLNGVGNKIGKTIGKFLNKINQSTVASLKSKFQKFGGDYDGYKELTKAKKRKRKKADENEPPKKRKRKKADEDEPPKKRKKPSNPSKPKKKAKPYRPGYRKGNWAVLVGLRDVEINKFLTKQEVIKKCQPYADSSFTEEKKHAGQQFGHTAWSGVNKYLVDRGFVMRHVTRGALFQLTPKGRKLAEELWQEHLEKGGRAESEQSDLEESRVGIADRKDSSLASDFYQNDYSNFELGSEFYQQPSAPAFEREPSPPPKPKPFVRQPGQWDVIEDFGLPPPGVTSTKLYKFSDKSSSKAASLKQRPASSYSHLNLAPARAPVPRPRISNAISSSLPFGWKLCLICDNGEKRNKKGADDILRTLEREDRVPITRKSLAVGDYLFIMQKDKRQMVLPMIIERKEASDLFCSIKDGRFLDQKWRLKKTELANQAYLIEGNLASMNGRGNGTQNVEGTLDYSIKICYAEGFHVFRTKDRRDTAKRLKTLFLSLRDHIHKHYNGSERELLSFCKSKTLQLFQKEYTRKSCTRAQTSRDRFGQMLMAIKGVNSKIAGNITERFPTLPQLCFALQTGGRLFLKNESLCHTMRVSVDIHRFLLDRMY